MELPLVLPVVLPAVAWNGNGGAAGKEVKWLKHYSPAQSILIVGDGDFSFSLSLATAFGSGHILVATSLDSYGALRLKHHQAVLNVIELERMGATVLHDVDAKNMKLHTYLKTKRFDRIVFNFPHAGFKGPAFDFHMISLHKDLVRGFLGNARCLLQPFGEIHISHKTAYPYDRWNLEQLASESSLAMIQKVRFQKHDYPGYNQKRGDGAKCNRSFPLGDCCTFKFCIRSEEPGNEAPLFYLAPSLAEVIRLRRRNSVNHACKQPRAGATPREATAHRGNLLNELVY